MTVQVGPIRDLLNTDIQITEDAGIEKRRI